MLGESAEECLHITLSCGHEEARSPGAIHISRRAARSGHRPQGQAAMHKVSLNQMIVEKLSEAANGTRKRADFSDLIGNWIPDAGFDEILSAERLIDLGKWK